MVEDSQDTRDGEMVEESQDTRHAIKFGSYH